MSARPIMSKDDCRVGTMLLSYNVLNPSGSKIGRKK
jgi:hypothetical protein